MSIPASRFAFMLSPSKRADEMAAQALQLDGAPQGFQDLAGALLEEYRLQGRANRFVDMNDGLGLIRDFQRWAEPRLGLAAARSCDAEIVEWMRCRGDRPIVQDTGLDRLSRIWG